MASLRRSVRPSVMVGLRVERDSDHDKRLVVDRWITVVGWDRNATTSGRLRAGGMAPETDNRIYSVVLTSQYFYPFGDLLRMLLYSYPTRGPFGSVFSELRLSWVGFGIAAAENCGFSVTCCAEDSELAIRLRRSADPRSRFSVARRGTVVTNRYPLSF